ncbi:MAG: hypothetical protein R3F60_21895 [bacterium]
MSTRVRLLAAFLVTATGSGVGLHCADATARSVVGVPDPCDLRAVAFGGTRPLVIYALDREGSYRTRAGNLRSHALRFAPLAALEFVFVGSRSPREIPGEVVFSTQARVVAVRPAEPLQVSETYDFLVRRRSPPKDPFQILDGRVEAHLATIPDLMARLQSLKRGGGEGVQSYLVWTTESSRIGFFDPFGEYELRLGSFQIQARPAEGRQWTIADDQIVKGEVRTGRVGTHRSYLYAAIDLRGLVAGARGGFVALLSAERDGGETVRHLFWIEPRSWGKKGDALRLQLGGSDWGLPAAWMEGEVGLQLAIVEPDGSIRHRRRLVLVPESRAAP